MVCGLLTELLPRALQLLVLPCSGHPEARGDRQRGVGPADLCVETLPQGRWSRGWSLETRLDGLREKRPWEVVSCLGKEAAECKEGVKARDTPCSKDLECRSREWVVPERNPDSLRRGEEGAEWMWGRSSPAKSPKGSPDWTSALLPLLPGHHGGLPSGGGADPPPPTCHGHLSKFHPTFSAPLRRSLETWGLRLVLGRPSVPGEEGTQAPGDAVEKSLLAMLFGLLREDPSAGHLASLLEESGRRGDSQLVYWAQVDSGRPRHRSIKLSSLDLLEAMTQLPSITILEGCMGWAPFSGAVGRLPGPTRKGSIREKAREDPERPWRASMFNLVSICELFWNHLSIGQQSSFREATALQHALLLLGRREDYLKGDLAHLLYDLQMGRSPLKPHLCAGKEGVSCCCCWVFQVEWDCRLGMKLSFQPASTNARKMQGL
uniref:Uncharacterized protein n=1 Tax=Sphaerodactylus townsendi TaxID=933632 RepID=A0ACB8F7A7_9SAUR